MLSPTIKSSDLLKAMETAIAATAIEQAVVTTKANEERNRSLPAPARSWLGNCHKFMVERLNAGCTQKSN